MAIVPGSLVDYEALKGVHYRDGRPGVVKRVFVARYDGPGLGGADGGRKMVAGVVVESFPALACRLRDVAFGGRYSCGDRHFSAAMLNREMRTISRVVVHPMFRSIGLAVELVKHLLRNAQTPYVEALAAMGRVHPFFQRAGMHAFDRPPLEGAVRFTAALEREGLRTMDLAGLKAERLSPFLSRELRCYLGRRKGGDHELLAEARRRILSQPVYFVWQSEWKKR